MKWAYTVRITGLTSTQVQDIEKQYRHAVMICARSEGVAVVAFDSDEERQAGFPPAGNIEYL